MFLEQKQAKSAATLSDFPRKKQIFSLIHLTINSTNYCFLDAVVLLIDVAIDNLLELYFQYLM